MSNTNTKPKLTTKQELALKSYTDPNSDTFLNMTKSVNKYYSCSSLKSAQVIGSKDVKPMLSKVMTPLSDDLSKKLTPEWILGHLTNLAQNSKRDSDRIRSLELLGKYKELGLFKDVTESRTTQIVEKTESELDDEYRNLVSTDN